MAEQKVGRVVQVIGPVLDVEFDPEKLPELYNALRIQATTDYGQVIDVTSEVQQHIGRNQVRAVAMSSTDSVVRVVQRRCVSGSSQCWSHPFCRTMTSG